MTERIALVVAFLSLASPAVFGQYADSNWLEKLDRYASHNGKECFVCSDWGTSIPAGLTYNSIDPDNGLPFTGWRVVFEYDNDKPRSFTQRISIELGSLEMPLRVFSLTKNENGWNELSRFIDAEKLFNPQKTIRKFSFFTRKLKDNAAFNGFPQDKHTLEVATFFDHLNRVGRSFQGSSEEQPKCKWRLLRVKGSTHGFCLVLPMPYESQLVGELIGPIRSLCCSPRIVEIEPASPLAVCLSYEFMDVNWVEEQQVLGYSIVAIGSRGVALKNKLLSHFKLKIGNSLFAFYASDVVTQLNVLNEFGVTLPESVIDDLVGLSICSREYWRTWNRIAPIERRFSYNPSEPIPIDPVLWAIPPMASDSHAPQTGAKP